MSAAPKNNPFKTRKKRESPKAESNTIEAPEDIAQAIESFRECQEQAQHFEGEAVVFKNKIMNYAQEQYIQKAFKGDADSIKITCAENMVSYIVQDSSAGITEEEKEQFASEWGQQAADDLIGNDFSSIKFDAKVLANNYEEVVSALQALPNHILENLFKPMLLKAKPSALEKARKYAKDPEELKQLMIRLKLKNYVK